MAFVQFQGAGECSKVELNAMCVDRVEDLGDGICRIWMIQTNYWDVKGSLTAVEALIKKAREMIIVVQNSK